MHACVQARIFQEMGDTFGERGDLEDLHKAIDSYDAALKIVGDTVPEAAGILLKKGMLLKQSEGQKIANRGNASDNANARVANANDFQDALDAFDKCLTLIQGQKHQLSRQSSQYLKLMDMESDILFNVGVIYAKLPGREKDSLCRFEQSLSVKVDKAARGGDIGRLGEQQLCATLDHIHEVLAKAEHGQDQAALVLRILETLTKKTFEAAPTIRDLRQMLDAHQHAAHCQEWICMAMRAAIEQDRVDDDVSASIECVLRAAKILPDHPGLAREACLLLHALLMKDLLNPAHVGHNLFHRAFSTGVVAVGLHQMNMQVQEAGSKFILEMLHVIQDTQSDLGDDEAWSALHTRGIRNILSNLQNRAASEDPHRAALTLEMVLNPKP